MTETNKEVVHKLFTTLRSRSIFPFDYVSLKGNLQAAEEHIDFLAGSLLMSQSWLKMSNCFTVQISFLVFLVLEKYCVVRIFFAGQELSKKVL